MAGPIRIGSGGPSPRIIIRKDRELSGYWEKVNYSVKMQIDRIDNLLEDKEDERSWDQDEIERAFNEQERRITEAVRLFQESIAEAQIDDSIPPNKARTLKEKLEEMQLFSEELPKVVAKKVIKRRAMLVTKWFWQQIADIREALKTENLRALDKSFDSSHVRKNLHLFRQVVDELDHCIVSTRGLKDSVLYKAMISKGKVLETKEDLILAFTEYKRLIAKEYPQYLKFHPELATKAVPYEAEIPKKIKAFLEQNKNLNPLLLPTDYAIPIALTATYKMIQARIRRRRLHKRKEECIEIEGIGESMHNEGQALRTQGSKLLAIATEDKSDLIHYGELLKQGSHLITIGIELKEKAILVHEELVEELDEIKRTILNQTTELPIDISEIAKGAAEILQAITSGSTTMPAITEFHWVGIGNGSLGVVMGKPSSYHSHTFLTIAGLLSSMALISNPHLSIVEIDHA